MMTVTEFAQRITDEELIKITRQTAEFSAAARDFTIDNSLRFKFEYSGSHFADPGFAANLLRLFKSLDQSLMKKAFAIAAKNDAIGKLQQSLQNALMQISFKLDQSNTVKLMEKYPADDVMHDEIQNSSDIDLRDKYEDLRKFTAFVGQETKKHIMVYRNLFPVDPSVYKQCDGKALVADIELCRQIKGNFDIIEGLYNAVFSLRKNMQHQRSDVAKLDFTVDATTPTDSTDSSASSSDAASGKSSPLSLPVTNIPSPIMGLARSGLFFSAKRKLAVLANENLLFEVTPRPSAELSFLEPSADALNCDKIPQLDFSL